MSFKDILTGGPPGAGGDGSEKRAQGHRRDLSKESISEETEEEGDDLDER
jgi:hypothetical protein